MQIHGSFGSVVINCLALNFQPSLGQLCELSPITLPRSRAVLMTY